MFGGNSLFSFFSNVKDKINSLFSSTTYSSKNELNKLNSITEKKISYASENNNYISYLLRKSTCKKPHNKKYQKQLCRSYSINEDSNLFSTLSETSTKENLCLNESQINSCDEYDEYGYRLALNNIIEGEQDFKTYYRYNSNIIGKKHPRYFFEENSELSSFNEDNNNINEKIKNEMMNSFPRKNKNKKKKSKIALLNKEKNIKDVRRLSNEFSSYKNKLKFQDNINNRFLKQIETNEQINMDKIIQKKQAQPVCKYPFKNLFFTHPERFSLHSNQTHKKRKSEKKEKSKSKKEIYSLTISNENNINIPPCVKIEKIENKSIDKICDENCAVLNISPIQSCETSNAINLSDNDFSFKEKNDIKCDNDLNLSKLIEENNNFNSSFIPQNIIENNPIFSNNVNNVINNNNYQVDNISNINNFTNNNNINNNIQDFVMDVDESNFHKINKIENNNNSTSIINQVPSSNQTSLTTSNNPFLMASNMCEKNKKPNENSNENNINSNNGMNKSFFEGKNLFNVNGNNNKNEFNGLNFSFGKS